MTEDEKREQANAKRAETYRKKREHEQAKRDERDERVRDIIQARAICRQIRDSDTASDGDKLNAIQILMKLGMDAPQEIPEKDDLPF